MNKRTTPALALAQARAAMVHWTVGDLTRASCITECSFTVVKKLKFAYYWLCL